jgi:glycosyltransferase involved in cell wall biosynthesis
MESIGAVVCTLNSENSIQECIGSLIGSDVDQIVVVDGGSTDETLRIVESFGIQALRDPGVGLGLARNIGIQALTTDLVLVVGSDNKISKTTLVSMKSKLNDGYLGVSCRTTVCEHGYIGRCSDSMWRAKITSGVKKNIGTPQLFERSLLNSNPFSVENSFSDDTELCHRLSRLYGGEFFTVEEFCEEIGKANFSEFKNRYRIYGLSDWEIYSQNYKSWTIMRRIKSFSHPLRTELITYLAGMRLIHLIIAFPLILVATYTRYSSWISKSRSIRKR